MFSLVMFLTDNSWISFKREKLFGGNSFFMKYLSYKRLGSRNFPEILSHAVSLLFFACLSLTVR